MKNYHSTNNHGKKIIQWANSGEGYTPVVRKDEGEAPTDGLAAVKKEIIELCNALGGTKNEELMATLKSYTPSGNPNAFRDLDKANNCLEQLKNIKPV